MTETTVRVSRAAAPESSRRIGPSITPPDIFRSIVGVLGIKITSAGLGLLTSLLLARLLGSAGYGAFAYALAWVGILAVPASFGLPHLLVRQVAKYIVDAAWQPMHGLLRDAHRLVGIVATGLVLLTLVSTPLLARAVEPQIVDALRLGILMLPFVSWMHLKQAAMQGLGRVVLGQLPEAILRPLLFVGTVLVIYVTAERPPSTGEAVALSAMSAIAVWGIGRTMLRTMLPDAQAQSPHPGLRRLGAAWPLAFIATAGAINSQITIVLLGSLQGAAPAGLYAVASRAAELVAFALAASNLALAPVFATLYARGEIKRLQQIVTRSARGVLVIAVPIAAVLIGLGPRLLSIFGGEFSGASAALTILTLGHVVNVAAGSVGTLLIMTGHEREVARAMGFSVVFTAGFAAAVIPYWGLEGAAWASAAGLGAWNLWLTVRVHRLLGMDATVFSLPIRQGPRQGARA